MIPLPRPRQPLLPLIEEAAGCLCPLLLALSLLPANLLPACTAISCLWLGVGHSVLYYLQLMPVTRSTPFLRGLSALAAGLLWPLIVVAYTRKPQG